MSAEERAMLYVRLLDEASESERFFLRQLAQIAIAQSAGH